ncbi:hypothetical protein CONPUDRAFT_129376 [Coniophora puteana RWD-64-598 SS2]|uniref:T6SS Phospholipase effector Tle1-like catalytic domain-containing protein n=1 Tax=Coniophora puteana (strain RWD-64-598) TaxID=741705 RepID=A0A5M3ME45_CONPW|nr:uncharacterized protein CONPUDRAFT_129376 [Coniophora puteana RWD-64-598 SS2]EIW77170.1 hypothetical protein CONPUDRAFT_129376 [Coniophora puteana RWD-64-598 SS2]
MASSDTTNSLGNSSATATQRGCRCAKSNRNLIVCIDGTSQKFGEKNSNVIALVDQIRKTDSDIPQITHYVTGVGTSAKPSTRSLAYWKNQLASKIDLAIAWDVEANIINAYQWLCEQYENGDKIFLFGEIRVGPIKDCYLMSLQVSPEVPIKSGRSQA